ncbi:hypothetical protein LWM68_08555 [Niabella sp. W65]|nr:hypothetical protein [Niabella sp. W65]MCH7362814.1 hypothetical protein [Niabella sp. W65]ULT38770.1 hypothetical protein KRR40_27250 [Niabella sp. I65]
MNRIFKNTPQTKTYRVVLLHLAGIAFVIGQHVLVMIAAGTPPTIKGYLTFLTEIAVFYTNLLWVVPLAFDQSRRVTFILRVAVLILLYTIIRGYLSYRTDQKLGVLAFAFSAPSLLFTLWRLTYALGYSFFLGLYWHVQKRRREQITLKLAVADAVAQTAKLENVMIHLRLNPHLLLSTLEHVHANVEEKALIQPSPLPNSLILHAIVLQIWRVPKRYPL